MLILGTFSLAITAVAVWSTIHGQNGFTEVVKMMQGQPAFIPNKPPQQSSDSGGETDTRDDAHKKKDDPKGIRTASDDVIDRTV